MDSLDRIIATRLKDLLEREGLRREDVARRMTALGFKWTGNRVTQVALGNRSMSVLELAGLCAALRLPVAVLIGDEGEVELRTGGSTVVAEDVWRALMGISAWAVTEPASGLGVRDEATVKAAHRLGYTEEEVNAAAQQLWGRRLAEERDRRVGDRSGESPEAMQARRGHVTRALDSELRVHLGADRG
jgi:transcriptional regulator with XRE-family HTH domain